MHLVLRGDGLSGEVAAEAVGHASVGRHFDAQITQLLVCAPHLGIVVLN